MTTAGGSGGPGGVPPAPTGVQDRTRHGPLPPHPYSGHVGTGLAWDPSGGPRYASWWSRVAAFLLDTALLGAVTFLAFAVQPVAAPMPAPVLLGAQADRAAAVQGWTESPWVVLTFAVLVVMQSVLGSTPGKLVAGIAVVRDSDGRPPGLVRSAARWLAHVLDAVLFLGYLRAAWHPQGRTIADSLLSTVVVVRADARTPAWWAGGTARVTVAAAWVVCVAAAGFQLGPSGASASGGTAGTCTVARTTDVARAFDRGTVLVQPDMEISRWGVSRDQLVADAGVDVRWERAGAVAVPAAYRLTVTRPDGTGTRTFQVRVEDAHADGSATLTSEGGPLTEMRLEGATVAARLGAGTLAELGGSWDWVLTSDAGDGISGPCSGTVRTAAP